MKFRIKKKYVSEHKMFRFYPQYRYIFPPFWFYFYRDDDKPAYGLSEHTAEYYIDEFLEKEREKKEKHKTEYIPYRPKLTRQEKIDSLL